MGRELGLKWLVCIARELRTEPKAFLGDGRILAVAETKRKRKPPPALPTRAIRKGGRAGTELETCLSRQEGRMVTLSESWVRSSSSTLFFRSASFGKYNLSFS